jgi:hypothetical protein
MIIIPRKSCTFYIKDESIILHYNLQYISYNVYQLQNRKRFKDFRTILLESNRDEYNNISEVIELANRFNLHGMVGHKPVVTDTDEVIA